MFKRLTLGFAAFSGAALATVPPPVDNFKPSSMTYTGPASIGFSGFCMTLNEGEVATRSQNTTWSNQTSAKLDQGALAIEENGSGSDIKIGKKYRKVKGGWLRRAKDKSGTSYYFYDSLPGYTRITFTAASGSQKLDPVLGRFAFGSTCRNPGA